MPRGFYVKVSPSQSYRAITNFFVKVSQSSWVSVSDAWVKVSPSSWQPFYSAATEPANPIEILTSFNSSEEIRLQGKNYRWSPSPSTLQYRFRVVNKETPSSFYDLTTLTTTTNPATGSSVTVPSSTTYNTVTQSGGNYFSGATNIFQFIVRATTASGSVVEKKAEYEFRIPAAPTLAIETLTSTSVKLTITAASDADYYATSRYIVYRYDTTAGFVYATSGGTNGLGAVSASTSVVTRNVTGLTAGRQYTFYVLPITGSTGITPTTHSGYPGVTANINNTPTAVLTLLTGAKRSLNTGVTFTNSSTTMYVSTNGYVAYSNNSPGSISIPTTGTVLNIFGGTTTAGNDLSQTNTSGTTLNVTFKNTNSYFVIRWAGRYLGSSTETLDYEARFYWNSDLVEVNVVTNNLNDTRSQSDNAVYSNGSVTKTWAANSSNIASWTLETGMASAGAPSATDDGFTTIVAQKPAIKGTGTKRIIPLGITVTSGSTIAYVSTNGFIGLNSDPSNSISIPSTGRYLNILRGDLRQTKLYADATSTTYSIRYQGRQLSDANQTVDYEIKFTFGSTSAEVFIITNNLSGVVDDVLTVNGVANNTWSGTNASTMTAAASTAITTNDEVDDARTAITLTATASVVAPGAPTNPAVSGSGSVSWTAPTTGGAVVSYEIEFFTASNGSGSGAAGPYSVTGITSSPSQLPSPYGGTGANWARARVRARNTGGASSYSAWAPSETTYV